MGGRSWGTGVGADVEGRENYHSGDYFQSNLGLKEGGGMFLGGGGERELPQRELLPENLGLKEGGGMF